jgi:hypothetical protein
MGSLKLGKPDVAMDAPSHVRGIHQGNERGNYEKMPGHTPSGTSTAERSTGVNAELEEPIAPGMPNLPPA